jgi:tetratricopeptide (TPR) repeat protein
MTTERIRPQGLSSGHWEPAATVVISMRRDDEELADLSRAIELDPSYADALISRGETCRVLRRYDEALADLSRAIELDPSNGDAFMCRSRTYWRMKRYRKALADFKCAIRTQRHAFQDLRDHQRAVALNARSCLS